MPGRLLRCALPPILRPMSERQQTAEASSIGGAPRASVVVVGDEILSGEVSDLNATWICRELAERGVVVGLAMILPDRPEEVAVALRMIRSRYDLVLISGGLGPTPDDITRAAVAQALGVDLVPHQEMTQRLEELFGGSLSPVQAAMAELPRGSRIFAPDGPAFPGFYIGNIYVFPGSPHHLRRLFPAVADHFRGVGRYQRELVTRETEFAFAPIMTEILSRFPDVAVGSYPDVDEDGYFARLTFKGASVEQVEAAARWMKDRLAELRKAQRGV